MFFNFQFSSCHSFILGSHQLQLPIYDLFLVFDATKLHELCSQITALLSTYEHELMQFGIVQVIFSHDNWTAWFVGGKHFMCRDLSRDWRTVRNFFLLWIVNESDFGIEVKFVVSIHLWIAQNCQYCTIDSVNRKFLIIYSPMTFTFFLIFDLHQTKTAQCTWKCSRIRKIFF